MNYSSHAQPLQLQVPPEHSHTSQVQKAHPQAFAIADADATAAPNIDTARSDNTKYFFIVLIKYVLVL